MLVPSQGNGMTKQPTSLDVSTTGSHVPALDGLRGMAIACVLCLHLFVRNPRPSGNLMTRFITAVMASGWVGVDLFFVLSGFLITGILYDTRTAPNFFRNFYARRALRIFPLYYGFILLVVAVSLLQGYHWHTLGLVLYLTYAVNCWNTWYTTAPWINMNHFWSLCIEEQFYLLWPAAVFLLARKRSIAAFALTGAAFSLFFRLWAQISGLVVTHPYIQASFTPSRLDGLLLGAVLALGIRSRYRTAILTWGPRVLCLLLVFWLGWICLLGPLPSLGNSFISTAGVTLLAVTGVCLIASVLRTGSVAARLFSSRPLRFLGRYSYGLYVFHYSIYATLDDRIWRWATAHSHSKTLPILASGVIILAISVVLAVISFHCFEFPLLRLKKRFATDAVHPNCTAR
jgi:peptidoglycan/LPS O-acetylase OafA/YrhL